MTTFKNSLVLREAYRRIEYDRNTMICLAIREEADDYAQQDSQISTQLKYMKLIEWIRTMLKGHSTLVRYLQKNDPVRYAELYLSLEGFKRYRLAWLKELIKLCEQDEEWYVIKKGKKYLTGHGYATGFGYKFFWSNNKDEARRFSAEDLPMAHGLRQTCSGTVWGLNHA